MRVAKRSAAGIPGEIRNYIPTPCRADAPADRVVVSLRMPTEGERRDSFMASEATGLGANGWRKHLILNHVLDVSNYATPEGTPINTAADLWAHGEHALVLDVAAELLSGYSLSEAAKKNSLILSGSENPAIQVSSGIADPAKPAGSTKPEDAQAAPATSQSSPA